MASLLDNWWIGLGFDPMGFNVVKDYDDDYNGKYEIGDLFIRESEYKGIYHAGVGYDEHLIVHLTKQSEYESEFGSFSSLLSIFSFNPGHIKFVYVEDFSSRKKFAIYRKKDGIDKQTFEANVNKLKENTPKFNLLIYNCIHFAMELLGVKAEEWWS